MNFRVTVLLTFILVVTIMGAERAQKRELEKITFIISETSQPQKPDSEKPDDLPPSA